jgi:beta-glucosidase
VPPRRAAARVALAAAAALAAAGARAPAARAQAPAAAARPAYRDPAQPVEARVRDLLGRMTLEEKVAQMQSVWAAKQRLVGADGRLSPDSARRHLPLGVGRVERPGERRGAAEHARFVNALQRHFVEGTRLGIPALMHEEGLHGLMAPEATSFPQAIALASAWDPALHERVFAAVAAEARARGTHQILAPVVDVAREPRWGRTEETYGEDPYLVARLGVAAVRGLQGRDSVPGPGA